jgi:L-fuculose-phosphate aldolase
VTDDERILREDIIAACRALNAHGLNQGTSGNISARFGSDLLITPSATPYDALTPDMIARMPLAGEPGAWSGARKPSTEWRFHHAILATRPEMNAVVHAHPPYATALAIARKEIPACHYMIAAFGGTNVRCAGYARFGTEALSQLALEALRDRSACLLANHGMIAVGETLDKAMWRAVELETIARHYGLSLALGGPVLLTDAEIAEAAAAFGTYGLNGDRTGSGSKV